MHNSDSNYIKNSLAFLNQFRASRSLILRHMLANVRYTTVYMDPNWQSTYAPNVL